jgi:hypothetical protein
MSATQQVWIRIACIAHAIIICATWYVIFMLDKDMLKARTWVTLAALWPIWVIAVAFPGKARRLRWLATLTLGLIILSPTFSTLYSFAIWSAGGFAP